ncbi:dynamin family [Fusarium longipes]|uniref:Dynamin family n=1 Tax=Fusarium longipes TaxID=694270 RepID=A0A395SAW3_9HYPO|nr:dynamin family [Fusarium longipes]
MGVNSRTWDIRSTMISPEASSELAPSLNNPEITAIKRWRSCSIETLDSIINGQQTLSSPEEDDNDLADSDSIAFIRKSDPQSGGTYLILDVSQTRALTCHQGQLRLEPICLEDKHISEQAQWTCTEKNGFKGFKNVAEGRFLGHDVWWDFYASASHHSLWESFTIARREGGLYWLQILHWWTQWQVSAKKDCSGVCAERDGGTLWEFVKVLSTGEGSIGAMAPSTTSEADQGERCPDSSVAGIHAPNNTTPTAAPSEIGNHVTGSIGLTRKSDPHHHGKYLIVDAADSGFLTYHNGHLRLQTINLNDPQRHISEQAQWECNTRGGF